MFFSAQMKYSEWIERVYLEKTEILFKYQILPGYDIGIFAVQNADLRICTNSVDLFYRGNFFFSCLRFYFSIGRIYLMGSK